MPKFNFFANWSSQRPILSCDVNYLDTEMRQRLFDLFPTELMAWSLYIDILLVFLNYVFRTVCHASSLVRQHASLSMRIEMETAFAGFHVKLSVSAHVIFIAGALVKFSCAFTTSCITIGPAIATGPPRPIADLFVSIVVQPQQRIMLVRGTVLQNRFTQEALVEFRAISFVRYIGRRVPRRYLRKRTCSGVVTLATALRVRNGLVNLVGLILAEVFARSDHGARCQEGDGDYVYPCAEENYGTLSN